MFRWQAGVLPQGPLYSLAKEGIIQMDLDIRQFLRFADAFVGLSGWAERMRDGRKRPVIPASSIFTGLSLMGLSGHPSLLSLDQDLRLSGYRHVLCVNRQHPFSDSTAARSLATFHAEPLDGLLARTGRALLDEGLLSYRTAMGRSLKVGVVDGTVFGNAWEAVLTAAGPIPAVLAIKRFEGRGHELTAAKALVKEAAQSFGNGFLDLILVDGLYFAQEILNAWPKEAGVDVLIKTDEKGLKILEDAEALFTLTDPDIEVKEGKETRLHPREGKKRKFDPVTVTYRVWAAGGFEQDRVERPLKVAKVVETHHTGRYKGQTFTFYVICTRQDLTALELRELAHHRWHIENNAFRALNAQMHTKHRFSREPKVQEIVIRILLILWTLLNAYLFQLDWRKIREVYGGIKRTVRWVQNMLARSILAFKPESASP